MEIGITQLPNQVHRSLLLKVAYESYRAYLYFYEEVFFCMKSALKGFQLSPWPLGLLFLHGPTII